MILRNFLFLDTNMLTDFLAQIEGYVIEGPIDQTEMKKGQKDIKGDVKVIKGGGTSEKSTEIKQRLATTDGARFQKFYELANENEMVAYLDAFDEGIWHGIRRGELLEVQAKIGFPKSFAML